MDCAVIRVRYQDISSGSHHGTGLYGTAKRCPQGVTIYLVPGLTARQRKAVIRRLRQEASRGCGPELPLPGLLVALAADRVRVAVTLTTTAVRLHPATTLLPTGFVAIGMMMLCSRRRASGRNPQSPPGARAPATRDRQFASAVAAAAPQASMRPTPFPEARHQVLPLAGNRVLPLAWG